jgi:uridine kinase
MPNTGKSPLRQNGLVMGATETVASAVRAIQAKAKDRAVVVALDGRSGAGKSTLAARLADTLDAALIHGDDFYRDMPDAARVELSPAQGVARYFDWERLREEALTPLVQRESAAFGCFNWLAGRGLTRAVTIGPRDIVIIEGVYSARPEFDDLLDLKVLVEAVEGDRKQRRQQRPRSVSLSDPDKWDARWDAAERVYFGSVRPRNTFDLVVSGSD